MINHQNFLIVLLVITLSCQQSSNYNRSFNQNTLAIIGDKRITVNDFIKRCEYVPRPPYCRGDSYIHKKIALNSLIAEKLLSLVFENNGDILTQNQKISILGQKEQTMRHLMLKNFGYDLVEIDKERINLMSTLYNRKYELSYILADKEDEVIIKKFLNNLSLNDIAKKLTIPRSVEEKIITIDDSMIESVKEILFYKKPQLDFSYGPFKTDSKNLFLFKVNGWTSNIDVSEKQKQDSWKKAETDFLDNNALKHYSRFVSKIMKGKKIQYNSIIFEKFSKKLEKIYLIERENKEKIIQNKIWEIDKDSRVLSFDDIKNMKQKILLYHDDMEYKVSDILELIKKHPLVFRTKNIHSSNFENELKFAIADLLRDLHITNKAYDLGYNDSLEVLNVELKWSDHIKAITTKEVFLSLHPKEQNSLNLISDVIDSLQSYYSDIVKIDTDKFEQIQLGRIDMNVRYSNQPYSKMEPDFPILTNDHLLDYGKKEIFND